MNNINIKNIEYYINLTILGMMAPVGYFAPLAEWILISFWHDIY